jgi:hypothetical protein
MSIKKMNNFLKCCKSPKNIMFVNYNKYKYIENWSKIFFYYIHCLETKKIHNLEPMSHGTMHIVNYMVDF